MKKHMLTLIFATVVCAMAALYYLRQHQTEEEPIIRNEQASLSESETKPAILYPIPADTDKSAQNSAQALPALNESDTALQEALGSLYDPQKLGELLIFKDLIRNLVVTIDNLPQGKLPVKYAPVKPLSGMFLVKQSSDGSAILSPENYPRYVKFIQLAEAIDTVKLASVYTHFYPLFQSAYVELGYPNRYFNDRVVEVIDHLLATPEVQEPIRLVRPSVFYKYENPALESSSAGQKILIRMGKDNAARLKIKLRELRHELTVIGRNQQSQR